MEIAELGNVVVGDGRPVVIIGVINLSEDSFYKDSVVRGPRDAAKVACHMVGDGAQIIDVGGAGSSPSSMQTPRDVELKRLLPAIRAVSKETDVPISVDTVRADVAESAVEAGASIINDISGLKADARMADVIARSGCSGILMASKKGPGDVYRIADIRTALSESLEICSAHGIPLRRIVIDPAFGQWPARLARLKSSQKAPRRGGERILATRVDLRILARLAELKARRPICLSISRKSSIGYVLDLSDPADRLYGSLAAAAIAVLNGANALRTHDPLETLQAARVAEAIKDAGT